MSASADLIQTTNNMSQGVLVPVLLAKSQWTPHPTLPPELIPAVSKFVLQLPELHCEEPIDGEQYLWPNLILDRLQDFAFTQGFAVVTICFPTSSNPISIPIELLHPRWGIDERSLQ